MNKPPSHRRPGALQAPLIVVAALAAAAFLAATGDAAPTLALPSMETLMTATTTLALQTSLRRARCRSPLTRQRIARGSCHA